MALSGYGASWRSAGARQPRWDDVAQAGVVDQPYFRARKIGSDIRSEGVHYCRLGQKNQCREGDTPGGVFTEWRWDGVRLFARNDRYGFYPLFYYQRTDEISISPSLVKLVAEGAPTELDERALAVFLRLGFFIGDDTPFKAIRALPPNASFEWCDGGLRVLGSFPASKAEALPRDEAIDSFISLFRAAVRRTLPIDGDFALPLSGGRDSRHILLALCEAGHRPSVCITQRHYPPRSNQDAEVASEVAKALQLTHVVLDPPDSRFQEELRKNLKTHFCADEGTRYVWLADYVKGRWRTLYDGLAGDVLSSGLFLTPERLSLFEREDFTGLAQSILGPEGYPSRLLPADQSRRFSRDQAIQHLAAELEQHATAPNPVGSFYFWNRTRREVGLFPNLILGEVVEVLTPFLDHDLHDFTASLPGRMLLDQQFHTDAIRRAYPRLADIPHVSSAGQVKDSGHFRRFGIQLARYALEQRPSRLVRTAFLLPRVLASLVYGEIGYSVLAFGPLALYLLQLERLITAAPGGSAEATWRSPSANTATVPT